MWRTLWLCISLLKLLLLFLFIQVLYSKYVPDTMVSSGDTATNSLTRGLCSSRYLLSTYLRPVSACANHLTYDILFSLHNNPMRWEKRNWGHRTSEWWSRDMKPRQFASRSLTCDLFAKDEERWPADKTQLADVFVLTHIDVLQKIKWEFPETFQFATVPTISFPTPLPP